MEISLKEVEILLDRIAKAETPLISSYRHIIVCGPSGAGKTTIIRKDPQSILRMKPDIYDFSVSCTTRPLRAKEVDGVDYRHQSIADFGTTDFIETNEYSGNCKLYGTPVSEVERIVIINRKRIIFDVDVHGAKALKQFFGPDALSVFLNTADDVLRERLMGRREETKESIETIDSRILAAQKERRFIESKEFIPDLVIPYNDISAAEAANAILLEAQHHVRV